MKTPNLQVAGAEHIPGTYVFDLHACNRTLTFNRFFWNLRRSECRAAYLADEEKVMMEAGLTESERVLVRTRDWLGIVKSGVCFFVLEKWARTLKISNLEIYASMRSEGFEEFMQTRRVPDAR
jgi:hypothetical protein